MTPEDLNNEIKLIFARACAESLVSTADAVLSLKDGDREAAAEAHGKAFASAFVYVWRAFIAGVQVPFGEQHEGHTDLSSNAL